MQLIYWYIIKNNICCNVFLATMLKYWIENRYLSASSKTTYWTHWSLRFISTKTCIKRPGVAMILKQLILTYGQMAEINDIMLQNNESNYNTTEVESLCRISKLLPYYKRRLQHYERRYRIMQAVAALWKLLQHNGSKCNKMKDFAETMTVVGQQ